MAGPSDTSDRFNSPWIAPIVFATVTFIALGEALFAPAHRVIGSPGGDLAMQFISWREFGFSQIRQGNLPLWNPHVFGGAPFLAGFQSALFYPPNWLHLILSLSRAINWMIALHVFAAGYFTYLWCRRRASVIGSIIGGTMFMFCGPYFLHIFPGHLPHVAVMVWIPLIFMSIDGLIESDRPTRWWMLGTVAIAMQVLAGHPQYVYYTAIVAAIYFALTMIGKSRREIGIKLSAFAAMYVAAAAISAVQLLPGIAATSLTVRSGGLPIAVSGTFSLPPENLLTALVPNLFGSIEIASEAAEAGQNYIGRGYLWESSLFLSVTGFILALIGAVWAADKRRRRVLVWMVVFCLLLALGRHTPLYSLMYRVMPKYSSFRGTVKFAAPMSVFVALLAAMGFDRVVLAENRRAPIFVALCVAMFLLLLGSTLKFSATSGWWRSTLRSMASSRVPGVENELFTGLSVSEYDDADVIQRSADAAARRALLAAALAAFVAMTIYAIRFHRAVAFALPLTAMIELLIFAHGGVRTTSDRVQVPQTWLDAIARNADVFPDARVLVTEIPLQNAGMVFGFDDLWGYDPGVLKRYAEVMAYSQGDDPDRASQYIAFRQPTINIFRAMRCNLVLLAQRDQPPAVVLPFRPLPTALLVRNYQVIKRRDDVLVNFAANDFDPSSSVILETEPTIKPEKGSSLGEVTVSGQTTDSLELRVAIDTPAILLITNNYTPEWRVRSLDASPPQQNYSIVPANWTQQAIALSAGKHHLRVEYSPVSFRLGKWISAFAICGFVFFVGWEKRSAARRG